MENISENNFKESLKKLRSDIPRIVDLLCLSTDISSWTNIIDGKLLPRFSPDFPLTAAICGGGSSGKSTLFNSLVGDRLSPSGGSAGINRRILVSAHSNFNQVSGHDEKLFRQKSFLSTLFEPLGSDSKPLEDKEELTVPGCPLYILNSRVPRNMVLMDTPDFDTGAQGAYTNRDVVKQALETSDILIYIFTNSNYNSRDNTDFISQMLTGIGMRKCFLVYRVYSIVPQQEVIDHSMTVARNLYGSEAEKYILGIYRADEDNAVAAGKEFTKLRPVRPDDPEFADALKNIDPAKMRPELLASVSESALEKAGEILAKAELSLDELRLYLDALQAVQSHCVHDALLHFPIDMAMKRFSEIWMSKDPPYLQTMRKTGDVVSTPIKMMSKAAVWTKDKIVRSKSKTASAEFRDKVEEDLLNSVNSMHHRTVGTEISVSLPIEESVARHMIETLNRIDAYNQAEEQFEPDFGNRPRSELSDEKGIFTFWVPVHPVVSREQEKLRNRDWKSALKAILAHKDVIIKLSENIEKELDRLADNLRGEMKQWDKIRQTLAALLNVVPATVAVTYVLSTGDAVGGVGIKVKLAGLFGLNDLYALVAIPGTKVLKKADQKQMETMLAPIAQTWLNDKLKTVQDLFEQEITGDIIRAAETAIKESELLTGEIKSSIELCGKVIE
ncbi:MAG: hypothetical protein GY795_37685 [Desulfobacterales bacterium]|nr:hypothetical protein [Desulfobacterales bacterium]